MFGNNFNANGALFSKDRLYRYVLWRAIGNFSETELLACPFVMIGLNPSTADETHNDPTIKRNMYFAHRYECSALVMVNLFSFRATNPAQMLSISDPVGDSTDEWIKRVAASAKFVICSWGRYGVHRERSTAVLNLLSQLDINPLIFGLCKNGEPKHSLYQRKDTLLTKLFHAAGYSEDC